ncbi:hypothetical protein PDESU_00827 [Pontiella desulfatans]|uniref:tRNA (Mo5U34)-methyltransferase n=1 Tax=Pontiella desulfatans TaxID=2750659 RepID=A0A6C2TYK5_PONDE|nr:class I SAM-dependent methyltransferase [Pontiella desulfatans]VGO12276.1 hypothetical protein PDESU_00827 [Pontiella desulfatans]
MDIIEKLRALYADESKHSIYQNTPQFIREKLGYTETIDENWRGDSARWDYLRKNMNFSGKTVLDVGANTGFFALSIAHGTPKAKVTALEGNENHSRYIETIADYFEIPNMHVLHQYLGMTELPSLGKYDTLLLFNVLHHAGVDFDQDHMGSEEGLFDYCVCYMEQLAKKCNQVIFQMGYNWGGNKQHPVIELDDDAGKVFYTAKFMRQARWKIECVLMPRKCVGKSYPAELNKLDASILTALNSGELDAAQTEISKALDPNTANFSEFYRRPLFICNSPSA